MVVITFLGSGAAIPSVWRSLPGILVTHEGLNILMDAGEGVQLRLQEVGVSPLRLTHILISHLHADHFNGLLGLIATMQLLNRVTQLTIIGPAPIRDWLPDLPFLNVIELHESSQERVIIGSEKFEIHYITAYHNLLDNAYSLLFKKPVGKFNPRKAKELGVPVHLWRRLHMGESVRVGNRLITPQDVVDNVGNPYIKVVYTGDTAPGDNVIAISRSADVLIHDSTYLDDMDMNEVHKLGHSTCIDAVNDAVKAGVNLLALTHVSYRYGMDYWNRFMSCAVPRFPRSIVALNGLKIDLAPS
ncbi:MAG: MBL fold metallo-hydrolase [Thermocladium sp.]|jgi:ribonuclease Z